VTIRVEAAEARARAMGHHEIASDAELENAGSIAAHLALGYEEVERDVSFRRSLRDA
jgi:aminoglycoside 6'-N-acetyltransferase I